MHELAWLRDLVLLFGLAIVVVVLCHRIKIPTLIGFLLAGIVAGPSVLGLIHDPRSVEILSEIGVVLLLFSVGIEFSLENLIRIRSAVFIGGGLQVSLTIAAVTLVGLTLLGRTVEQAVFLGMLVAGSSTAIVMKLLAEHAEVESPHGRIVLGIGLFQDLCIVPMMLLVPFLAGEGGGLAGMVGVLVKALAMVALSVVLGRHVVPWILQQVVSTRSREVFLLVVIILCLGTAWLSSLAGLSLALGAFIAGLIVSESEYSQQALGEIIPFREVFMSLFLVSMGLLLDLEVLRTPLLIGLVVAAIIAVKAAIVLGIVLFLGYPLRTSLMAAVMLAQVGEFSFVLAQAGSQEGIVDSATYQAFLASAILSMMLMPLLKSAVPRMEEWLGRVAPRLLAASRADGRAPAAESLEGHVIIVGYGVNGRNLASVLRRVDVPYIVVELNPETVAAERRKGTRILYGDASNREILEHAMVRAARVLVIAISDPTAIRRMTAQARALHPTLHIIVRTRFLQEMKPLLDLGANEVVPEEFETSLEMFARTLRHLLVPRDVVERFIREARLDGYGLLRAGGAVGEEAVASVHAMGLGAEMEVLRVEEGSPLAGRSLAECALRKVSGATILALRTGERLACNPSHGERLEPGTVAVVFGTPEQVAAAARLFRPSEDGDAAPGANARSEPTPAGD